MYHPFSVAETIKTAWNIFKKNFVTIIVYSAISFFLLSVLALLIQFLIPSEEFIGEMLVSMLLIFVQAYTTLGLYKLIFTVIDSEYYEFEYKQVLPTFKMVVSYIAVVFILAFVLTNSRIIIDKLDSYPNLQLAAISIAIILGLFLLLRIMFFNTFIVDDRSGPLESLKQSFQLTKGYFFKVLIILIIILVLIALPAKLAQTYPVISIAILFTYPFVNIILAVTYRKLVYSHKDVDDDIAETY
jgi:hypothetical protein